MTRSLFFSIAELVIEIDCHLCDEDIFLDQPLRHFSLAHAPSPHIRILPDSRQPLPLPTDHRQLFTATPGGLWTIFRDTGKPEYLITLHDVNNYAQPYTTVETDDTFHHFHIYLQPMEKRLYTPLEYPLDELIVSGHININNIGILLHSAAIIYKNEGILFSGVSGSGKSTLSQIWQEESRVEVVTDERVILKEKEQRIWAFGTPWHGTAVLHRNMGAPLRHIYFIRHGRRNHAARLSFKDSVNRLMVRCFPTFWHRKGMEFALDFCIKTAMEVACYELEFLPDSSVIDFVTQHTDL